MILVTNGLETGERVGEPFEFKFDNARLSITYELRATPAEDFFTFLYGPSEQLVRLAALKDDGSVFWFVSASREHAKLGDCDRAAVEHFGLERFWTDGYTVSYTEGGHEMKHELVEARNEQEARETFRRAHKMAVLRRGAIVSPGALIWYVRRAGQ